MVADHKQIPQSSTMKTTYEEVSESSPRRNKKERQNSVNSRCCTVSDESKKDLVDDKRRRSRAERNNNVINDIDSQPITNLIVTQNISSSHNYQVNNQLGPGMMPNGTIALSAQEFVQQQIKPFKAA